VETLNDCRTGDEPQNGEEEVDIDLNDPDVEAAAVKIQAGFKGFKVRQESQRCVLYDRHMLSGYILFLDISNSIHAWELLT